MNTYRLNIVPLDADIAKAQAQEAIDAKLTGLIEADLTVINRPGVIERLPSGLKNTGKTEGYLRGLLYGGQAIKTAYTSFSENTSGSIDIFTGGETPAGTRYVEIILNGAQDILGSYFPLNDDSLSSIPSGEEFDYGIPLKKQEVLKVTFPKNLLTARFSVKTGTKATCIMYG